MKKIILWLIIVSFIAPIPSLSANQEEAFKVIVNASNPTSELTVREISKLFLKKVTIWKENDEVVLPIDQVISSPVRVKFSIDIHERKISAIKAYWQKQIFSGRSVPPEEKGSEAEILDYVAKNAGAIGYVSDAADMDSYDVKIVRIIKK